MKRAAGSPRAFLAPLLALAAVEVQAQEAPDWQWSGSNTLRAEYYRIEGDPFGGPYSIPGRQYYDDISLNFVRRFSKYDVLRGQFSGVANDSAYRASDRGFVPERINLTREKGDGAIPYRAEAGDLSASFSYRTLQRSLRGAQVELQPLPFEDGSVQSIMMVTGASQSSWRHFTARDDWTTGISWLYQANPDAHFSANAVHVFRQADGAFATPMRQQVVASVTGDYRWQWASQKLHAEGELAGFRGDHEGSADASGAVDPASGRDRRGEGVFAQLSGETVSKPLTYRLRFERYDRDFRPVGGVVAADHSSGEAFTGWTFADGRVLSGRVQHVVDGAQAGNELKTDTVGATLAGVLFPGFSGNIDAFWQELSKRDSSVDQHSLNLSAYLAGTIAPGWDASLTLSLQQLVNRVPGAYDTRSALLTLAAGRDWRWQGWSGRIAPALVLRRASGGPAAVSEADPGFSITANRLGHSFTASYGYQRLRPDATSAATVDVNQLGMDYHFTKGSDTVGIELSAYDRRVTIGQYNDTYRASLYWTHTFDTAPKAPPRIAAVAMDPNAPLPRGLSLLLALPPGADLDAALGRLEGAGFHGAAQGRARVYEAGVIDDLDNRQRLVVVGDAGRVARTVVILDIADPNNPSSVSQAYERARKAMLDRFGSPANSYDQGAIGPTLVADLNAGRVTRTTDWRTAEGTVRLGIPRRMDGQVRIEIQHAPRFASPREGPWGLDEVR